jgi:drug/metabolite transporter (DMT)-like permease
LKLSDDYPHFWKGVGLAATAALMWAALSFALKQSFIFATPQTLSWFRLFSSFVLLFLFLKFKKSDFMADIKRTRWIMIPASLGLAFNYVGYAKGLELTTPGNAQMLIQMGPFLITIFTFLLGREKPTWWHLSGIIVATFGFFAFYQDQLYFFINSIEKYKLGNLWIIGASISWAYWAFIQRDEANRGLLTSHLNLYVWGICAFALLPFADISSLLTLTPAQYLILSFLALNTLIAYGTYTLAYMYAPTAIVNLIIGLNPILVFMVGSDPLGVTGWMGALLVFLGLMITLGPQILGLAQALGTKKRL